MYVNDLDARLTRYEEYWAHKNSDRPLLSITCPVPGLSPVKQQPYPGTVRQRWWDEEYVLRTARQSMERTCFLGEALPMLNPNLGPDVFAAFLGSEIHYEDSTSYSIPTVQSWENVRLRFDENNPYWKKIEEMTRYFIRESHGDFLVGVTDLHEGMDALVSMRGPENLCMDLYDCPQQVKRVRDEAQAAFARVLQLSYRLIADCGQKGTINWMGIYHPENWYVSSSDFIYLISDECFEEFSLDSIQKQAQICENSIFHLDGVGSLRHLDKLLELPEIQGVQWVYGAGKPTARYWIDVLKKIQDAGKCIEINCVPEDMQALFESGLKPEGVRYSLSVSCPEQGRQIMQNALDAYRVPHLYVK